MNYILQHEKKTFCS